MENKKKRNIIVFFIVMVIAMTLFDMIMAKLYPTIASMIIYGKYGRQVIVEGVCAILILIVLLLFKNSYVFTEKKQGFLKSLLVGGYITVFSTFMLAGSLTEVIGNINILDLGSLALYCLLIGIFEEFLCRGWIQNEFIERFANNRKQIIVSILLSSLIFGGMHISNIWIAGQSVLETMSQIIQATGMGFLLGAIYFRTKNIWSVVFLHGFWDFALFVGELNTIKACSQGATSTEYKLAVLTVAVLMALMYITIGLYVIRKHKTQGLIKEETLTEEELIKSKKSNGKYIFTAIVLFSVAINVPYPEIKETCYEYKEQELYYQEITYPVYTEYTISENDINIKLSLDKNNQLIIENLDTKEKVSFDDKIVDSFIVIKNNDKYNIMIVAFNEYGTDTEVYYTEYINISEITNTKEYLTNIINSIKYIDKAPTVDKLGYINSQNTNYIIIDTYDKNQLVYYNNDLYVLNRTTIIEESSKEENSVVEQEEQIQQEENPIEVQPEESNNQEQIKQEQ